MVRSKKSMYNLLAAMLLQIVNLLVGIIIPRALLVAFGSEINGLVSSIRQFVNYLTLVEAGLAGACIYSLYKPLAEHDSEEINRILSGAKKYYNRSGSIFSFLALGLAIFFPWLIESNDIQNITIIVLVLILGINGSLEFFSMGKYRVLLTADQKSYIISIVQSIGLILNCVIIVFMSLNGYSIILIQLVATSSYLVRSILLSTYVKRNYKFINFNSACSRTTLHQRWDVLFHQLGGMIVFNSPIAIITIFCSLDDVSVYSVYNMIFVGVSGILGIFNSGLVAGFGDLITRGNQHTLQNIYKEYECGYYMLITWIYSCTYILIIPFIKLYTDGITDTNYILPNLATLFIIIGILNAIRVPQSTIVNAAGYFKQTRYRALLEVSINLITSLIFVKYFGMIGVLYGGLCSYIYRSLDFIFFTPKYLTKLPVKDTFIRIFRMILLATIIIYPFIGYYGGDINSFLEWILYGFIVSVWSAGVIFLGNYLLDRLVIKKIIFRVFNILNKV